MKMKDCPVSVRHLRKWDKIYTQGWKHQYYLPTGYGGLTVACLTFK